MLSCGSHILSRIPATKFDHYKTIAIQLSEHKILPSDFKKVATKMAGYRNRLLHFYHEINKAELYQILKEHLTDLEKFHRYLLKFTRAQKNN